MFYEEGITLSMLDLKNTHYVLWSVTLNVNLILLVYNKTSQEQL